MADILSQSQIDELLNSFSAEGTKAFDKIDGESDKKIKSYDFRIPKKFTKEKLKTINAIYEIYSRLLSSYLTGLMRQYCKISVLSIEEQRYYEYSNALPEYVMMGTVNFGVEDERISDMSMIFQLSNPISYTIMDRLMGGNGVTAERDRDFTEIEVGLMEGIITKMVALQGEAWNGYSTITADMTGIETNSRMMQMIGPDEVIVLIVLEIQFKEVKNTISICIPALNLEQIMKKLQEKYSQKNIRKFDNTLEEQRRQSIIEKIKDSKLEVTAVLAQTEIDMYDLLTLQVNDVIPLNKAIDKNVVVKIGNNVWFDGKLGIKNKHKAVKIDNIYKN